MVAMQLYDQLILLTVFFFVIEFGGLNIVDWYGQLNFSATIMDGQVILFATNMIIDSN